MKLRVILISHGDLAKGMANSAQMIAGANENLSYYGLQPGNHPVDIIKEIQDQIEEYAQDQFIVIADIFGGSVCNTSMDLLKYKNVRVLSGMNLSMIIELLMLSTVSEEDIDSIVNNAKEGIKVFTNELLLNEESKECFF